jgi:hypothetical protein
VDSALNAAASNGTAGAVAGACVYTPPAATIITGIVKVEVWAAFMAALQVYTPLIVAAIGGLVWGTNSTEPHPCKDQSGQPAGDGAPNS